MCKFNQNLFIVWCSIWLVVVKVYLASPVDFMLLDELLEDNGSSSDHDLTYDQRQNGTENIRVRLDGVIIAIPSSASSHASNSAGNLAANYLLQLAANADDDDDDTDYFPFVKSANGENSVTAPSLANEKESPEGIKDDKTSKKKIVSKPDQTKSDQAVKRVVIVNGPKDDASTVKIQHPIVNPIASVEEQSKFEVIPVKKVQSRRKNKHKLRLAGLLDFLERYREQY